jgi:hypothetical protein
MIASDENNDVSFSVDQLFDDEGFCWGFGDNSPMSADSGDDLWLSLCDYPSSSRSYSSSSPCLSPAPTSPPNLHPTPTPSPTSSSSRSSTSSPSSPSSLTSTSTCGLHHLSLVPHQGATDIPPTALCLWERTVDQAINNHSTLKKTDNYLVEIRHWKELFSADGTNTKRFTLSTKNLFIFSIFPLLLLPQPKRHRIRETLSEKNGETIESVVDALNYLRLTPLTEADCVWLRNYYLKEGPPTRALWSIVELRVALEKERLVQVLKSLNESLAFLQDCVEDLSTSSSAFGSVSASVPLVTTIAAENRRKRSVDDDDLVDSQRRKIQRVVDLVRDARELSLCSLKTFPGAGEGV